MLKIQLQKQSPQLFCKKRPEACNFIKNETLTQVFYCEFCEIFKNNSGRLFLQLTLYDLIPQNGQTHSKIRCLLSTSSLSLFDHSVFSSDHKDLQKDKDDEFFCDMVDRRKSFSLISSLPGLPSEIFTIANIQHAASRICLSLYRIRAQAC